MINTSRILTAFLWLMIASLLVSVTNADAASVKPRKVQHCQSHRLSPPAAVRCVFPPRQHKRALRIMWCESSNNTRARNGQYRGLFQLGTNERRRYAYKGYRSALQQVQAAHNLWTWRGWQPWSCR